MDAIAPKVREYKTEIGIKESGLSVIFGNATLCYTHLCILILLA